MSDKGFTDEDFKEAAGYTNLGPAYFAARRAADALFTGDKALEFNKVLDQASNKIKDALYEYTSGYLKSDMQDVLESYIRQMVEDTVKALCTGEEWALKQYPLSQYHDGQQIRAAIAQHCGESVLKLRVVELEKEVARLTESIGYMRRY